MTEVDHAAEKSSSKPCSQPTPTTASWLKSRAKVRRQGSDFVWVIDPLDGTTNFIHGFPVYCVSIALTVKGKVEQAVVYDPTRNDLFTATKRPWRLPERAPHPREQAHPAWTTADLHRLPLPPGRQLQELPEHDERRDATHGWPAPPRCCSADLAYVAAGFTDGFFRNRPVRSGTWLQARCW